MTKPSPNAHLDVPSDRGDFGLFGVITSGCHGWLMLPASFPEDTKRRLCPHEMGAMSERAGVSVEAAR